MREGTVLSTRALNRALLARQMLLERVGLSAGEAIERLVGLQAQAPQAPYVGLWARLADFAPDELSAMVADRRVVRLALLRATVHLVTARDALALRPVVQPVLARGLRSGPYGRKLAGLDLDAVAVAARDLVEERPRTLAELRPLLGARWPDRDAAALAQAAHYLLPLVQVPPRGTWGGGGLPNCTTAEAWLGRPLAADAAPDALVRRYLAAFGPASVQDIQQWSGLTSVREAVARLRPGLRAFRDAHGRELLDVPEGPLPDPETPAPVRFLPEFDNLLLSHADRTRVIAEEHRRAYWTAPNGLVPGGILVDGFAAGQWKLRREKGTATLLITPFAPLAATDRDAVAAEGERLLAFAAAEAGVREVGFA